MGEPVRIVTEPLPMGGGITEKIVISSQEMKTGVSYEFNYMGMKMAAVKTSGGAIDIYQVAVKVTE